MKEAHITYSGMDLDYMKACALASSIADKDANIIDPVMVAWHDKRTSRMSPVVEGGI